jgi:hypothetical protein
MKDRKVKHFLSGVGIRERVRVNGEGEGSEYSGCT